MRHDRTFWKTGMWLGGLGLLATFTAARYLKSLEESTGAAAEHVFMLNEDNVIMALMFGTTFLLMISAYNTFVLRQVDRKKIKNEEELGKYVYSPMVLGAYVVSGGLMACAIYALDIGFFNGELTNTSLPNAGPEGELDKFLYASLYSFVGLVGLVTFIYEFRLLFMEKVTQPQPLETVNATEAKHCSKYESLQAQAEVRGNQDRQSPKPGVRADKYSPF